MVLRPNPFRLRDRLVSRLPMATDDDFSNDTEFCKLLARRSDVNLPVAALELARDAEPLLSFEPTLDWIAARGLELAGPLARAISDRELLTTLLAHLRGLRGDEACYTLAECSYINHVTATGRGIPISLAVVMMAVAEAAGVKLAGVSAPMHFLARYESMEGTLFLDAFGRRIMAQDECMAWLADLTGMSPHALRPTLRPVGPREIILRMLGNLKNLHVRTEDWEAAYRVQNRLTALQPAAYDQRRDLALAALKSHRPGRAIDLLKTCLKDCPESDRTLLGQQLAEALRSQAHWN